MTPAIRLPFTSGSPGTATIEESLVLRPKGLPVRSLSRSSWGALTLALPIAAALLAPAALAAPASAADAAAAPIAADAAASIRINEVESDASPTDWIELTNIGTAPVDISGWVVKDDTDTRTDALPTGTILAPGAFFVFDQPAMSYGLGKADSARLFAPDGTTLVDSYSWTAHAATTYGRCADGTGAFTLTAAPTKGAPNACVVDPADVVRINEVESSGGTPGDWVEFTNIGTTAVDASGLVLRDDDDTHSYVLPAGSTIPARGFIAVGDPEVTFGLGGADAARLFAADGSTLIDSYSWTAHAATTYGRCADGTGAFALTTAPTRGAANACAPVAGAGVRINEIESNGGTPGDWVELLNPTAAAIDLSGWIVKDSADDHVTVLPAGATIAPGAFFIVEESTLGYGLGSADSVRLFAPDGVTLVDQHSWTSHAALTLGRCPDATGPFAATTSSTKGAPNVCDGTGGGDDGGTGGGDIVTLPWAGEQTVDTVDPANLFGTNLSGLAFEQTADPSDADTLWAVKNGPGTLYRLDASATGWAPSTDDGWSDGKLLHYADGTGDVDAEGVTFTAAGPSGGIFVSTERNNADSKISRPSIIRYDVTTTDAALSATREWNLAADLATDVPTIGANAGLEGITWIPDADLVAQGFVDERTGAAYNPASYPNHGDGLFFVGLEANGSIYAYALDQNSGAVNRVATITSGFPSIMELEYDPATDLLWAVCDDTCEGRSALLSVAQKPVGAAAAAAPTAAAAAPAAAPGRFAVTAVLERPTGMPNVNNEGFAIAPNAQCTDGLKPAIWSDDNGTDGHSLRQGTIACLADAVAPAPVPSPAPTTAPSATPGGSDPAGTPGMTPVRPSAASALASTGATPIIAISVAAVLLLAGIAVFVIARVRRSRSTAAAETAAVAAATRTGSGTRTAQASSADAAHDDTAPTSAPERNDDAS